MLGWIVRLAVETGMRSSEITGLRRSQVDLNRRVVPLKDTKNGSARLVPLSRVAAETLRSALHNPIRPIDTDLVFFGEPGRSVGHGMVLQFPRVLVERWPYLATDWPAEAHLVMQIFSGNTINQIFQFVGFIHDLDRDTEL